VFGAHKAQVMMDARVEVAAGSESAESAGDVRSNETVRVQDNAYVAGDAVSSGEVKQYGNSTIAGAIVTGAPLLMLPSAQGLLDDALAHNDNASIPMTSSGESAIDEDGALVLDEQETLTLAAGTYVVSRLRVKGDAQLFVAGTVTLFVEGEVKIRERARVNADGNASSLRLVATTWEKEIRFGTDSITRAGVYASDGKVVVKSHASLTGAIAAYRVELMDHAVLSHDPAAAMPCAAP
jgi:hypothetical protein